MDNHARAHEDTQTLVSRAQGGDERAFAALLETFLPDVTRIAARHVPANDVEAVVQDGFTRAFLAIASFRGDKPFLHFLSAIATRACHDYWRAGYRRREKGEATEADLSEGARYWLAQAAESGDGPAQGLARAKVREVLAAALDQLKPTERMVLSLVHLEERPVKEAAELLGISVTNTKVRAFRARKRLKSVLENMLDAPALAELLDEM